MKKLLVIFLALVLCLSSFNLVGCKEESTSNNVVILNSFENFDRDIQVIRVFHGMGAVSENRDKQYVKEGKKSISVVPVGLTWHTHYPYIVIPTTSINYNINEGNFTKVEKVTCWVYNTSDKEEWMSMGVTGMTRTHQYAEDAIRPNGERYYLQPGWNFIEYFVYPEYLAMQDGFDVSAVYGLFFEFDRAEELNVATAETFYIDDVRLHKLSGEREKVETFNLKSDVENGVWEVCDFEDTMQSYHFYIPYVIPSLIFTRPYLRAAQASEYDVTAKSGTNVLEFRKRAGVNTMASTLAYMEGSAFAEAFKNIGQDLLDNPQNYEFRMDIFNASEVAGGFTIEFSSDRSYDENLNSNNSWTGTYFSTSTKVEPGEWLTYAKNIGDIDNNITKRAATNSDEYNTLSPVLFSQHPGGMSFAFGGYRDGHNRPDRVFLLDNLRIVKVA